LDVRNSRASCAKSLSSMGLTSHVIPPMPVSIQAQVQVYLIVASLFKRRSYRLEWPSVEWPLSSKGHADSRASRPLDRPKGRAQRG